MLSTDEKRGGNPPNRNHVDAFRDTLACCELAEVKSSGNPFTWANGQSGEASIEAKLDRFLASKA